jgi:hypothetical protein
MAGVAKGAEKKNARLANEVPRNHQARAVDMTEQTLATLTPGVEVFSCVGYLSGREISMRWSLWPRGDRHP